MDIQTKIVGMVPARLGSKRVKNKNLRLIGDKPLVEYVLDSALKSKYLDEIYINSESDIFKTIADKVGVKFYKRPNKLSSDTATNDEFALNFINNIECDILIQLLPTSPFITHEEIDRFIKSMIENNYETMVSVTNIQIECIYKGKEINFDRKKPTPPSQDLAPVQSYACSIMGWNIEKFRANYKKYKAAYHGGDGYTGYFVLKGYSTIDIDNEEDFKLSEVVSEAIKKKGSKPRYFTK